VEQILAGWMSGGMDKSVIAPGDRVKILYHVNAERTFTLGKAWKTASNIVRNNGWHSLWRGNLATMMRIIPHSGIGYMMFDRTESAIQHYSGYETKTPFTRFVAGAVAGGTATMVSYPFDLMRARMAAHWGREAPYPSYQTAFRAIIGTEGPLALYHGLKPTLLGVLPYSGISFATFHTLKGSVRRWKGIEDEKAIGTITRLVCGATAGLVAQTATYPLDIVRRRMQVQGAQLEYNGVLDALQRIHAQEGVRGLYKGVSMNWIKGPIAVAVSFTANDLIKDYIRQSHVH